MPCLLAIIALSCPRLILFLVWLLGDGWLQSAFQGMVIPLLGFFFVPLTTLAWAFAWHMGDGNVQGAGYLITAIALLLDLGCGTLGRSGTGRRTSTQSG